MDWILNNISTIIVSSIILGMVILIIRNLRKKKSVCGGSCGGCGLTDVCHTHKNTLVEDFHANEKE